MPAVSLPVKVPQLTKHAFNWFLNGHITGYRKANLKERLPLRERTLLNTEWHSLNQILKHFVRWT
jgi:hypothetical protein